MGLPSFTRRAQLLGVHRVDVVWPGVFALVGIVEMTGQHYTPLPIAIGTYLAGCAATTIRRAHPVLAAAGVLITYAAAPLLGFDVSQPASWMLPLVLASFGIGRYLTGCSLALSALSVAGLLLGVMTALALLTGFSPDAVFGVIGTFGPWALGVTVRNAEDRAATTALEAERARVEDQLAADRSVRAERDRLAREIHDVLAHSLSLMVVQAAVAESLGADDPEAAQQASREVQAAGRAALDEVGRLVRLIREEPVLEDLGRLDHIQADLVGGLRTLGEDVSRAGLPVTLDLPETGTLSPALQLTVYRIVQEALTNALKYAVGARAHVSLLRQPDLLEVSVSNTRSDAGPPARRGSGNGLAGLQERVALYSGTLSYGPDEVGGFTLVARLPCAEAS